MQRWNFTPNSFRATFMLRPSRHMFIFPVWFSTILMALEHAFVHLFENSSVSGLKSVFFCSICSTYLMWLQITVKPLKVNHNFDKKQLSYNKFILVFYFSKAPSILPSKSMQICFSLFLSFV